MDGFDEQQSGAPETSGGTPEEAPKLSAAFLPYDDERLWVGMPADQRGKKRSPKRRPGKRAKERTATEGSRPTRASRLSRPLSFGRRHLAAAIVALVLPVTAFAVTGALSRDVVLPGPPIADPATLSPGPMLLDVVGLRAERVTPKQVELAWEVPAIDGPLTYVVYRDGVVIAETTDPSFVDADVEPQRYYYYAVATTSEGRVASSPQLLVAVPSESGQLPSGPAPVAPGTTTVLSSPSPSPSPSKSPSPTRSKVVWPSTDFGSGGGGGGGGGVDCTVTPTDPSCPQPPVDCTVTPTDPSCPQPPAVDCTVTPTDPSCPQPSLVLVLPPSLFFPLIPLLDREGRRRRKGEVARSRWLRWLLD